MGVYVHADSGELWNYYVTVSNIQAMADKECEDISNLLKYLYTRMEEAMQTGMKDMEIKESELAGEKRKEFPDKRRIRQLEQEIDTIQFNMAEIRNYKFRMQEYAAMVEKGKKEYHSSVSRGRRFLNNYLKLIEDNFYEEFSNDYSEEKRNASNNGFYTMNFRGITFYCNDSVIDLKKTDAKGRSNLQRMEKGLAPIGADGLPVNLHHMLQSENGSIIELSETTHKTNYHALHINSGSDIPSGINRMAFGVLKKAFWQRRAQIFKA